MELTIILAIYGVALTTYEIIRSSRERKRRLKLYITNGWLVREGNLSTFYLFVNVINIGSKRVTIDCPKLELADGKSVFGLESISGVRFPFDLEDEKSTQVVIEMEKLRTGLLSKGYTGEVKFWACVSDATDKNHKSDKPWFLDLAQSYE